MAHAGLPETRVVPTRLGVNRTSRHFSYPGSSGSSGSSILVSRRPELCANDSCTLNSSEIGSNLDHSELGSSPSPFPFTPYPPSPMTHHLTPLPPSSVAK